MIALRGKGTDWKGVDSGRHELWKHAKQELGSPSMRKKEDDRHESHI